MLLIGLKLKNFRCYKEEVFLSLGKLTAIIGTNDAGKSSLLDALDIFFNESPIESGDASAKGDKSDVCITAIFSNFKDEIILDSNYPTSLCKEYLLNSAGHLEVIKKYNCNQDKPKCIAVYLRANYPSETLMNDLHTLTISNLKKRLKELDLDANDIDLTVNSQIRQKIWSSRSKLKLLERDILISDKEAKNIWEQLKKQLPIFALFKSDRTSNDQDSEAQDPMKAAVKEALKAEQDRLDKITESVKKEVLEVANLTVEKIREMDPNLANQLSPKIELKISENIFKVSLTGDDEIPINKRGSGVRRLILLNFFRAQVEKSYTEKNAPGIIYAIEEPETSQHPKNQRLLMKSFMELAENSQCQILLTTHTPLIDGFLPIQSLRYLEISYDKKRILHNKCDEELLNLIVESLGVLPENKIKIFIGVEGINDINFLTKISKILNKANGNFPDLEQMQNKRELVFIPVGGSNLKHWINRLEDLNRPEFHLHDRDQGDKSKENQRIVNEINNHKHCKAILTKKREMENYFHPLAIKQAFDLEVDINIDDECDVPELVAQLLHQKNKALKAWHELDEDDKRKKKSRAKAQLNNRAVEFMSTSMLDERDPEGDLKSWFIAIRQMLYQANPSLTIKREAVLLE